MLPNQLRSVLEEIIEPGGGPEPKVDIIDPNDPQINSKKDKMKNRPRAVKIQLYGSSRRKMWMPGGNA